MDLYDFYCRLRCPVKLEERCLERITQVLLEMNKNLWKRHNRWRYANVNINNMDKDSNACLSDARNYFVDLPGIIIPEIISKMFEMALHETYSKKITFMFDINVFRVLLCKPIKRLNLTLDLIQTKDFEEVFKIIKQDLESQLTELKFTRNKYVFNILDPTCPNLTTHLRDMHSLTHLKIHLNSDDSLLESIGGGCPNLKHLEMKSHLVTRGGLKSLYLNPKDKTKRCQKLESLILYVYTRQDLTDDIAALLLALPQLEILRFYEVDMGKVLRMAYDNDQQQQTQLKIQYIYPVTSDFCQQLHPLHLSKLCPHLKKLSLVELTTDQLGSFPVIPTLREVSFHDIDGKTEFDHGVIPFLQNNGKFLQLLHYTSSYFNYTKVAKLCKNLKVLYCQLIQTLDGSLSPEPLFMNLEYLRYKQVYSLDYESASRLIQLISNCHNLRRLSIAWSKLKIDHLLGIISQNPFPHLVSIDIESGFLSINADSSDATSMSTFLNTLPEMYNSQRSLL